MLPEKRYDRKSGYERYTRQSKKKKPPEQINCSDSLIISYSFIRVNNVLAVRFKFPGRLFSFFVR